MMDGWKADGLQLGERMDGCQSAHAPGQFTSCSECAVPTVFFFEASFNIHEIRFFERDVWVIQQHPIIMKAYIIMYITVCPNKYITVCTNMYCACMVSACVQRTYGVRIEASVVRYRITLKTCFSRLTDALT